MRGTTKIYLILQRVLCSSLQLNLTPQGVENPPLKHDKKIESIKL